MYTIIYINQIKKKKTNLLKKFIKKAINIIKRRQILRKIHNSENNVCCAQNHRIIFVYFFA